MAETLKIKSLAAESGALLKTLQSLTPYATSSYLGCTVIIYNVMETTFGATYYEFMFLDGFTSRAEEDAFDQVPPRPRIAKNRKILDFMLSTVQQVTKVINKQTNTDTLCQEN